MKLVIGIIGPALAGKETVADELERLLKADGHSVSRHRFSDILRDTLDLWGVPHGRDNEQPLAQLMDRFAKGTLSHAVENRLAKDSSDVGILDGMRWYSDEAMLRGFSAKEIKNVMIYVTASADRRYERLRKRNRAGEAAITREKFDIQMQAENETYIPEIGARADIKLTNDYENIADLRRDVQAAYKNITI